MKAILEKLKNWLGVIPLTVVCIVLLVVFVYVFKAPVRSFIESIQRGLRKPGGKSDHAQATQVSEENKSIVPDSPKNYQALGKESSDNTTKVLQLLDKTLETLKNVKTSP